MCEATTYRATSEWQALALRAQAGLLTAAELVQLYAAEVGRPVGADYRAEAANGRPVSVLGGREATERHLELVTETRRELKARRERLYAAGKAAEALEIEDKLWSLVELSDAISDVWSLPVVWW